MKHTTHIRFDMEEDPNLSEELVEVQHNFYTRRTSVVRNSMHFPVPKAIILELNLKASDSCFFYQTLEGFYISFKEYPEGITEDKVRERKLTKVGQTGSIYLVIPPMIKHLYPKPIKTVKLIRTKGLKPNEWQIQFLSTDFT